MPGSEIQGCARNQSLNAAQSRQEVEAAARPSPVPCALRLRKQRLGQWAPIRSRQRQTCRVFPGGAVPSGVEAERAVFAVPLSAEEAGQPPLDSPIQLQQAPPL